MNAKNGLTGSEIDLPASAFHQELKEHLERHVERFEIQPIEGRLIKKPVGIISKLAVWSADTTRRYAIWQNEAIQLVHLVWWLVPMQCT
jgi:hypothetical protein